MPQVEYKILYRLKLSLHLQFLLYSHTEDTIQQNTNSYGPILFIWDKKKSKKIKKTHILRKLDPFSWVFDRVHKYTYMDYNHDKIRNFSKLRALLIRRSCNMPLMINSYWMSFISSHGSCKMAHFFDVLGYQTKWSKHQIICVISDIIVHNLELHVALCYKWGEVTYVSHPWATITKWTQKKGCSGVCCGDRNITTTYWAISSEVHAHTPGGRCKVWIHTKNASYSQCWALALFRFWPRLMVQDRVIWSWNIYSRFIWSCTINNLKEFF